jgi:cbb3-type cytochrome oxidase maturation protein
MEILILLMFVSVVFVGAAVAFFVWSVRQETFDHGARLSLLPLEEPASPTPPQGDSSDV